MAIINILIYPWMHPPSLNQRKGEKINGSFWFHSAGGRGKYQVEFGLNVQPFLANTFIKDII